MEESLVDHGTDWQGVDDLGFVFEELLLALRGLGGVEVATRETIKESAVAGFGARNLLVEELERSRVQGIGHQTKTFTTPHLDDAGHEESVEEVLVGTAPDVAPEALDVEILFGRLQDQSLCLGEPEHLVKVFEFLSRQDHHFLNQDDSIRVVADQGERHGGGFSLATSMVEQERIEVGENRFEPLLRTGNLELGHVGLLPFA
jgi:hypothetical protein